MVMRVTARKLAVTAGICRCLQNAGTATFRFYHKEEKLTMIFFTSGHGGFEKFLFVHRNPYLHYQ